MISFEILHFIEQMTRKIIRAVSFGADIDTFGFARNGTITNEVLRTFDNLDSQSSPEVMAYDVILRKISVSNSRNNVGDYRIDIYTQDPITRVDTLIHSEITDEGLYKTDCEINKNL